MNTPAVPEAPLQGVVTSTRTVTLPGDLKAHAFFNVIRDLLNNFGIYHNESDLENAHQAVTDFEKHILDGPHYAVISEVDRAPKEDVTQRAAPVVGTAIVPLSSQPLDYNKLAAALLAMQRQQQEDEANTQEGNTE